MSYNTEQRKILLNYFDKNRDTAFSAEDISIALKDLNISLSAVYRNLSALEKDGKLRRVTKTGSRKAFYQYLDCDSCKGHLHISCTKCGQTMHLDDNEAKEIDKVLKQANFKIDANNTILYGTCNKCDK